MIQLIMKFELYWNYIPMSKRRSKPSYEPKPGKKYKKISDDEKAELTAHWYEKLKKEGFRDLEFYDESTGVGQGSHFLKDDLGQKGKAYKPETEEFYHMLREFVGQHDFKDPKLKFIAEMYAEAISFRNMIKNLKKSKWRLKRSIFWIHSRVEMIRDLMDMYFEEKIWDFEADTENEYELGPGFTEYRAKYKKAIVSK